MTLKFSNHRYLSEFSTFGIGGPIAYFAEVKTFDEMKQGVIFSHIHKLPLLILGKGSNSLFDDRGFRGVVLLNKLDFISWGDCFVSCGSGYSFSLLGVQSARKHMSGLEFACGIPATVGGAIFMNAGASGRETKDSLESVTFLDDDLEIKEVKSVDLEFGYRFSSFQQNQKIILSAKFHLQPQSLDAKAYQTSLLDYRLKTQPYKYKSIGCIFKNPQKDLPAGRLIEQCGLKGLSVGDASVSNIHANFIVNLGSASAKDVEALIELVQSEVLKQTSISLQTEIRRVSYE